MRLYGLPINPENYSRAGSALVALRDETGVREMDILVCMNSAYTPNVTINFPSMAGLCSASLSTSR